MLFNCPFVEGINCQNGNFSSGAATHSGVLLEFSSNNQKRKARVSDAPTVYHPHAQESHQVAKKKGTLGSVPWHRGELALPHQFSFPFKGC